MENTPKRRRRGFLVVIGALLALLFLLPLILAGLSLIGRVSPASVLPPGFSLAARVPRAAPALERMANHETVGELAADPAFSAVLPLVSALKDSSFPGKGLLLASLGGELDAALYPDKRWIAAFDTGLFSSSLRLLPLLAGRISVPNLYYVQAGPLSRFEYRPPENAAVYVGLWKNLLVATDSSAALESILRGEPSGGDFGKRTFHRSSFDAALLVDPAAVTSLVPADNGPLSRLISSLSWGDFAEVTLSLERDRLDLSVSGSPTPALDSLKGILASDSSVPSLLSRFPHSTQYETLISAGPLTGLVGVWKELAPDAAAVLDKAERGARLLFGAGLGELLFDWAGDEVAVFGLEGRPKPVFAVKIADEDARKRAFDRIVSSVAVAEDDSTVLDGYRISRITLPDFLASVLSVFGLSVPSPYWMVDDGYLLASESPETLLAAVSSRRKGETLAKNDTWRALASSDSARASASVFYSLDRSTPFFLKGKGPVQSALRLYREGCLTVRWEAGTVFVSLVAVPGSGGGVTPIPGFPVRPPEEEGSAAKDSAPGREVSVIRFSKKGGYRILSVLGGKTLGSYDPATGEWIRRDFRPGLTFVPATSAGPETPAEPSVWTLTDDGEVSLLDGNLETLPGFPALTGTRPASRPAAAGEYLYFADLDSSLKRVGPDGSVETLSMPFTESLRSPPSSLVRGGKTLLALYPKSFFSQVWLTDDRGTPLSGWPRQVSGIAYGSPVFVTPRSDGFSVAFITQAGDLYLFDGRGEILPGFPLSLTGVFYTQPHWDGEYLWALAADGVLWRVDLEGKTLSQQIPGFKAESGHLASSDVDGDGTPEIFLTGDGNALYGYGASFNALASFPLPAWGTPWFGDLNGDGTVECVASAMDGTIGAWQFRKERSR